MVSAASIASLLIFAGCPPEEARLYISKPIGWRLLGCALAYAFLVVLPTLVKPVWPEVIAAFPSTRAARIWGTVGMNVLVQVSFALAMLPLYAFDLFPAWRIERSKPWPWAAAAPASERARFWRSVRRSSALVPFNAIVLGAGSLHLLVLPFCDAVGGLNTDVKSFPAPFTVLWQLGVCMLVEDALFYWTHRTMHNNKFLYRNVHKWHHEYTTCVAIASEHAHPMEFLAGNLLPLIAGPLLLRAHLYTVWSWLLVRIFISVEEHCGYSFPWSPARLLPFGATPDGHDFHHSQNVGMYASMFVFWDRLCGTDGAFCAHLRKKELAAESPAAAGESERPTTRARAKAA